MVVNQWAHRDDSNKVRSEGGPSKHGFRMDTGHFRAIVPLKKIRYGFG